MGRYDNSPPSSPSRKRERLSSPTYDEQLGDLSQDDLAAFDEIDYLLSQRQASSPKRRRVETTGASSSISPSVQLESRKDSFKDDERIPDDPENPFSAGFESKAPSTSKSFIGFASASALSIDPSRDRSPSPLDEEPPEQDFSAWFAPADDTFSEPANVSFSTASASFSAASTSFTGFQSASKKKSVLVPSAAALAKAQNKMRQWEKEDGKPDDPDASITHDDEFGAPSLDPPRGFSTASQALTTPQRAPLRSVQNIPNTPPPASAFKAPTFTSPAQNFTPASGVKKGTKPFVSPFLSKPAFSATPSVSSRLNPNNPATSKPSSFANAASIVATPLPPARSQRPGPSAAFTTPSRTPMSLQRTIQKRPTPSFKTPFKPGMKPGESGRLTLSAVKPKPTLPTSPGMSIPFHNSPKILTQAPSKKPASSQVFNLARRPDMISLSKSGLHPRTYTPAQLEEMTINVAELSQITIATAKYYSFHSPDTPPHLWSETAPNMGPKQAYQELLEKGCNLVKQDWVDNHWAQILWKLAGMVTLQPDRENTAEKKWSYREVMRQLLYRYEREINQGRRPALRLVTTQDAPAAYPMALCVSNIFWSEGGMTDDGIPIEPHPTLEVSDGWYSLRARVDEPMARAARRGLIRIGRKIICAGARISSEKKEPAEPLEAYESMSLILSGNSTHLAPWHAKLGFTLGPWVSTMNSLTGDGGLVAVMDVVVVKVHKLGFVEQYVDDDGNRRSKPPVDETGETKAQQEWEKKRESETTKLFDEYEKKWYKYEGYMDRLERRAQAKNFRPSQDYAPTYAIESLYDDLEDPVKANEICSTLDAGQSGLLAQHIKQQVTMEKGCAGERIREEVDEKCPPRNVRSFRVLIVEDARTCKKPATRKAQLTVTDVLKLSLSEDSDLGEFKPGQRFLVTNTIPSHPSAWMAPSDEESEIYLKTSQSTRWTTLKA